MIASALLALVEWGAAAVALGALALAIVADPAFLVVAAIAGLGAANLRGLAMLRHLNRRYEAGAILPAREDAP